MRRKILAVALTGALLAVLGSIWAGAPRPALAAPANDNFASAVALPDTFFTFPFIATVDTAGATLEGGETAPCPPSGINASVWYSWTPSNSGTAVFETFGSNYDTVLAVYTGPGIGSFTNIACNDDFGGLSSRPSAVSFAYTSGTTYHLQISAFGSSASGNLVLNFVSGGMLVVNSTADGDLRDSALTLHEAIKVANGTYNQCAGLTAGEVTPIINCGNAGIGSSSDDMIHFNPNIFPVTGGATIPLNGSLPALLGPFDYLHGVGAGVTIDGQTGSFDCLTLSNTANRVGGLKIRRCLNGINITGGSNTVGGDGVGGLPALRNVITENGTGVRVSSSGAGNSILDNYIGVDASGNVAAGNGTGVAIDNSPSNFVQGNVVSGNSSDGVSLVGAGTQGSFVVRNLIGTDAAGTADLGNGQSGVLIWDGNNNTIGAVGQGNVISGNNSSGVFILPITAGDGDATGNVVHANYIGTDATGTAAIGNGTGVTIFYAPGNAIGGTNPGQGNVISGNFNGISISAPYAARNLVQGNYVGTNAAGTGALPNASDGVSISGNATSNVVGGSVGRNVISGNGGSGITITGAGGGIAKYNSTDVPKTIADFGTAQSRITAPEQARITDLNVTLDISHTRDADLVITLTPPNGPGIALATNRGGNGDNFSNTIFDDEAATPVSAGTAPFTGSYRPETPLSQLDGFRTGGIWTLNISDFTSTNFGTLNSWSLTFTTEGNHILNNYIGTDVTGTAAIANGTGVTIQGSPANLLENAGFGQENVISGNSGYGVNISGAAATGNIVRSSYIGTNESGTAGIPNANGILISGSPGNLIGGVAGGEGNVISANSGDGISIQGSGTGGNAIQGNYIGTNATGTAGLANNNGIVMAGDPGLIGGTTGTSPGGPCTGACNLISGNTNRGISLGSGNTVQGNYIGTNSAGTGGIGNGFFPLDVLGANNVIGGSTPAARNIVSANSNGITISGNNNTVEGNYIGTQTDGVSALGNLGHGVWVFFSVTGNVIGGTGPGEHNTIAFNGASGVNVEAFSGTPAGTRIRGNVIHSNGGLGIDLDNDGATYPGDGVTANDAGDGDTGPNGLQNFPVIQAAAGTEISGSLNSTASTTFAIDLYVNFPACDGSGYGEGGGLLASTNVTTDGAGNAFFTVTVAPVANGVFITATATDPSGNTSEFSKCLVSNDDADDDNDGFTDVNEAGTPLCGANVNNDGPPPASPPVNDDTVVNDGCPAVGAAESGGACTDMVDNDGDGAFNDGCPQVGAFAEGQFRIGTGSLDPCGNNGWPLELVTTGFSANRYDIVDLTSFVAPVRRMAKNPGQNGFNSRWDLIPGPIPAAPGLGWINVQDLTTTTSGTTAFPPMLGGARVLNQTCPFPP